MMTRFHIRDLWFILPTAAVLGAGLASLESGLFWLGWAGFSCLLGAGLWILIAAWRGNGGGRVLAVMTGLALVLRLGAGVALYIALPIDGYNEPDDDAGYVFTDAHRRDDQAWELATSGDTLWSAFDKRYYTDQYGGLLAASAFSYRILSPDAHRPLLILSLAALVAALGVPFFATAAKLLWDERVSGLAAWIFVLYPESVLTGGAQMREPFLLTLIAVTLWGYAQWLDGRRYLSWSMLGIGLAGMLLVSPAIALIMLVLLIIWYLLTGGSLRIPLAIWVGACVLAIAAIFFLGWSLESNGGGGAPITSISGWVRDSVSWVIYQLERGSGQVQNVFSKLIPGAQLLFVVAYGITQPLLPPAFLEPTTFTWRIIAVLRSLGWYAVLPLLVYAPVASTSLAPGNLRRVWIWLSSFSWIWVLICAIRAGGDQWDNPRYRLIFFGIQALVTAFAWLRWKVVRDAWLPRILAAEIWCLVIFGQWYLARYYLIGIHFPVMVVMSACITGVALIMISGFIWDRRGRSRFS